METQNSDESREIESIKDDPKVKRALMQSLAANDSNVKRQRRSQDGSNWWVTIVVLAACAIVYFLISRDYIDLPVRYQPIVLKLLSSVIATSLILLAARVLKKIARKKIDGASTRYNLTRIIELTAAILIFVVLLSILFDNWYATMVSFGIISLILGLALQNPITSFFAWIYILVRRPYEVGDRIRIGNVKGDVIELGYFDTTLWEFGGEYLSGDHPSGRIIRFANSKIFGDYVYNYSWPLFPFIWNEVTIFLAYESDLKFVVETIQTVVEKEVGEDMVRRVRRFKSILSETAVDQLEVKEYPSVIIRANSNTWVEVVARYLVEPKASGQVKNRIFNNLMTVLKMHPEKALFPKTNMR